MNYNLLILGVLFLILSFFFNKKKELLSLFFLFFGSLFFGFFISTIDSFLNTWDEQFHALVAKNIGNNGLVPMLYTNHYFEFNYKMWVANEVWLHKQPLFIWQIALSIKTFGVNEISVRLPSIIMHAFTSVFIYHIGKLLLNNYVGIIAAILFSVSFYQLELITGKYSTDHNDVAFLFYCTGSFFTWFKYMTTKSKYWLIFIAFFSGGAVLVKWLLGLLVYVIWFLINISFDKKNIISNFLDMFISASISLIIFLPWQIYILYQFPKEANHEYSYNSLHLYQAVEDHSGIWNYHFNEGLNELYGDGIFVPWILLLGVIIVYRKSTMKIGRLFFIFTIVFIYIFFTLVATKMLSYTIVSSPFLFISIGAVIYYVSNIFKNYSFFTLFIVLSLTGVGLFNFKKIKHKHSIVNNELKIAEKKCIESLDYYLNKQSYLVFNFNHTPFANISAMFYSDYECYDFIPTKLDVEKLKDENKKIACILTTEVPDYIKNDPLIVKILK